MANLVCFLAARAARAGWDVRAATASAAARAAGCASTPRPRRTRGSRRPPISPASAPRRSAGSRPTPAQRMDVDALRRAIEADVAAGDRAAAWWSARPASVSTGAVDPLPAIARALPRARRLVPRRRRLRRLRRGRCPTRPPICAGSAWPTRSPSIRTSGSTRRSRPAARWSATPSTLRAAFAYHPPYYHFEERATNYVDYGPQNSRGFRALKVWLALRQVGAAGYRTMIGDDIRLSRALADAVRPHAGAASCSRRR